MRKIIPLVLAVFLFSQRAQANTSDPCPETHLESYKTMVLSKAHAERIFQKYFSQAKGFPPFDASLVKIDDSPSCSKNSSVKSTCYYYSDMYGMGPSGLGGYLYPNGKLVKRGYCK